MSNAQWHEDQAAGDRAQRYMEDYDKRAVELAAALLGSGITRRDCEAVARQYAMTERHRVAVAMAVIHAWLSANEAT